MGILSRLSPFPHIAVLHISGVITPARAESYLHVVKVLQEGRRFAGVILNINSHGGSVASTENLYLALKRLASRKPLFCYVFDMATSGGYWLACSSPKIYAPSTAVVGG